MKMLKNVALVLVFILLFGMVGYADSDGMQAALLKAKALISVPETYTEFQYRSETDSNGTVYWNFNWAGEKLGDMSVTIAEDGFLSYYYSWVYTEDYQDDLADYTHEEAKEIARSFVEKVNPEIYPYVKEVALREENRSSRTASFYFQEYLNELPVYQNVISVTVDKQSGTVRSYQGVRKTEPISTEGELMSEADAKKVYLEQLDLNLQYHTYYRYRDKEYRIFPSYSLKKYNGNGIDAISGLVTEPYFEESALYARSGGALKNEAAMDMLTQGAVPELSPIEMEAINEVENVLSKEKALQTAQKKITALSGFTARNAVLRKDYRNQKKLYWDFSLQNQDGAYASVTLDAVSGKLNAFSLPSENKENKSFTEESAQKIAEAFLEKEAGTLFKNTVYQKEERENVLSKFPNAYWFTYVRMENGIPVVGDQLQIRVDTSEKRVGYYSCNWTEDVEFPTISGCMTPEEILEIMDKKMHFALTYMKTEDGYRPVYTFLDANSQCYDPFSGIVLNYDGTQAKETILPEYTDIANHWAEEMILSLLDNGYYFHENEFQPDKMITKKEFLQLFRMIGTEAKPEEIAEIIAAIEGIAKETVNPDEALRKELASRYFIYRLGYQKIAELDEIYREVFLDIGDATSTLKGDIAIAAGLEIFHGDPNGNFYPQKNLTRAEAASAVYHYLKIEK